MASLPSFLIKSNLPINGEHWGLEFTAGVAVTEDVTLANKLIRKGYAVTCVSGPKEELVSAPPAAPAEPEKTEEPQAPTDPKPPVESTAPEVPLVASAPAAPKKSAVAKKRTAARKSVAVKKG